MNGKPNKKLKGIKVKKSLSVLVVLFFTVQLLAQETQESRFEKVAAKMVKAINDANYPEVQKNFAQSMKEFLPLAKSKEFFHDLTEQYGKIQKLDRPQMKSSGEALFTAKCEHGVLDMKVWLDDKDKIVGLQFLPHSEEITMPEKNKNPPVPIPT